MNLLTGASLLALAKSIYYISVCPLLPATRGAPNPNLSVVITHSSHVCSQHSFGLPLGIYRMHRTQFDHSRLDLLSLAI